MRGCVLANVSDKSPTPPTASYHEDKLLFWSLVFFLALGTTEAVLVILAIG